MMGNVKHLKEILFSAFLWTLGLAVAIPALLVIILMAAILPGRRYNTVGRALLRLIVRVFGGRVTVEGLEHLNPDKTYLFMPNHVSLFDIPILGGYIPNFTRGVEAAEQFNWPLIGWFIRSIGNIPIDRSSVHSSWSSLEKAAEQIRGGKSIIIMPEGTRTRSGKLSDLKKLPFRLAQLAGVDIIPVGLSGLFRFKPRDGWIIKPGPLKVKFGDPILFEEFKTLPLPELSALVRDRIEQLIEFP
jgi:1-acyl-sn-glycerol-3-phosphate acyltransferase